MSARLADAFAWTRAPDLEQLMGVLGAAKDVSRFVGGCVRDSLIGLPPGRPGATDIDIATILSPGAVMARLDGAEIRNIPTGLSHGTVTAVMASVPYEITTLRTDAVTDGRHAEVEFVTDWALDAGRRDFTINALYLKPDGQIEDFHGGADDLQSRRVRFIGDPRARITEDCLRILRLLRFTARYGEDLDKEGWAAAVALKAGLGRLSKERIWSELSRLFSAPGAPAVVTAAERDGIMSIIFPQPAAPTRFARLHEFKGGAVTPAEGLAALFGPAAPTSLRAAFKPPNAVIDAVGAMWAAEGDVARRALPKALLYDHGADAARAAIGLSTAHRDNAVEADYAEAVARTLPPVLPIRGRDLIAAGAQPGPSLGDILAAAEALWIKAGYPDDEATIEQIIADVVAGA